MARTETGSGTQNPENAQEIITFHADGQDRIDLPSSDFIADAKMTREGENLILQAPNGETVVIEGYFSADPAPVLTSAEGATLTPNLVDAFSRSPLQFAAHDSANDESPIGAVEEVKGSATVTRADGTIENITIGTPVYQGDIVETDASGAVNIVFIDETSMAVSEKARLSIDEYTFDPATESGTTNFSVLRGLFVFTSGLIGRDDPDDVSIDTPVGSIGIRGTVIAGDINPTGESKITVMEGAIVVKNGLMETVISQQFETVSLHGFHDHITNIGVVPANDISQRFHSIGDVNPGLFSTVNDAAREQSSVQQPSNDTSPAEATSGSEAAQNATPSQTAQQTQTTAQHESVTSAEPTATAPAPAPLTPEIAALDGNVSGLPSQETVSGNPSGGLTGTNTVTGSASTAAPSTATSGTGDMASAPAPVTGSSPSSGTTSSATGIADATQPPPSVTNEQTSPTLTEPVAGLVMTLAGGVFNDLTSDNVVIGTVSSSGTTGSVTYAITSPNNYFDIDPLTGKITLSSGGAQNLGESLSVLQLGGFTVTATSTTGETKTQTFGTTVTDAHQGAQTINLDVNLAGNHAAIVSDTLDNKIGYTITALGDINNDGFDDFAFSNDTSATSQNHSYILYGKGTEFTSANLTSLSPLTPDNHTPVEGNLFYTTTIAGIGDFNGDGIEDFMIGQPENNTNQTSSGTISIISGADMNTVLADASMATSVFTGSMLGQSVSGVGDFDNDGYADIVAGAPGAGTAFFLAGRSFPYTSPIAESISLSQTGSDGFGSSVSGIGDFNGDGYSDFAVGAPYDNSNAGLAYIYTGGNTMGTPITVSGTGSQLLGQEVDYAGDLNNDGYSDLLVGGDYNSGRIVFGAGSGTGATVSLNVPDTTYTLTGAGGVGDFNGDGYDDFALSFGDANGTHAYVVYGKDSWSSDITLADLKNPDFALELTYSLANSGDLDISRIGDINGDGYDDFAMGLPDANGATAGNGGLAIVYGRDTGAVNYAGTSATASGDGQSLVGTKTNDTFNDNGHIDVSMRGGSGTDIFVLNNTDFARIDGGGNPNLSGDSIRAMADLDFTGVNFEKISGIEKLAYGADGLTLTLTMENLFNLMKSSDGGTLKIDGGSYSSALVLTDGDGSDGYTAGTESDQVLNFLNEAAGGTTTASLDSSSGGYDTFKIGGYTLIIDQAITVDAQ
ncbi:MAG TPA: FG-GAP-like repeat-containing protein [Micavibrio sp.]|nr:FG-GAP-like repeat-containing protein [Micavibrio sp.]